MKIGKHTCELLRKRQFKKAFIHFQIDNNWFSNRGKFKVGDRVTYNWKGRCYLSCTFLDERLHSTHTVSSVWGKGGSNVDFAEGSGADVFWLRKV